MICWLSYLKNININIKGIEESDIYVPHYTFLGTESRKKNVKEELEACVVPSDDFNNSE